MWGSTLFSSLDSLVPTPEMNSENLRATYWDWNFFLQFFFFFFLSKSGEITVLEEINYLCALGGKWVNESWSAAISATVPHLLGHLGGWAEPQAARLYVPFLWVVPGLKCRRILQCNTTSHFFTLISWSRVGAPVVGKHAAPPSLIREYERTLLGHGLIALNPQD